MRPSVQARCSWKETNPLESSSERLARALCGGVVDWTEDLVRPCRPLSPPRWSPQQPNLGLPDPTHPCLEPVACRAQPLVPAVHMV